MATTNRPWSSEVPAYSKLSVAEILRIEQILQRAWDSGAWSADFADLDRLAQAAIYGEEGKWLTYHARRAVVAAIKADQ